MPAVTSLSIYGATRLSRALGVLGGRLVRGLARIGKFIRNRRDAAKLSRLDDHMLADIGLTRSDLRDAYAESLWRDPTDTLARRAAPANGELVITAPSMLRSAPASAVRRSIGRYDNCSELAAPADPPSAGIRIGDFPSRPPNAAPAGPPAGALFF